MSTQPTCEERIDDQLKGRADHIAALFAAEDAWDKTTVVDDEELTSDDASDRLGELPLSIELIRTVKILLSTGGPADWLEARLDDDGVSRVEYHFADWYDHAERTVEKDSPLWRYAEQMSEYAR
jgi:hypothetical protein